MGFFHRYTLLGSNWAQGCSALIQMIDCWRLLCSLSWLTSVDICPHAVGMFSATLLLCLIICGFVLPKVLVIVTVVHQGLEHSFGSPMHNLMSTQSCKESHTVSICICSCNHWAFVQLDIIHSYTTDTKHLLLLFFFYRLLMFLPQSSTLFKRSLCDD